MRVNSEVGVSTATIGPGVDLVRSANGGEPAPPVFRGRQLRRTQPLRRLARETTLSPGHLIAPLFVKEGAGAPVPIPSLPGCVQHTLDSVVTEVAELIGLGVPAVILFGIPAEKDPIGTQAVAPGGGVQRALRLLRREFGDRVALIADLCLCEYTDHGHCGILAAPPALPRPRRGIGSRPWTTNAPLSATPRLLSRRPRPAPTWWRRRE